MKHGRSSPSALMIKPGTDNLNIANQRREAIFSSVIEWTWDGADWMLEDAFNSVSSCFEPVALGAVCSIRVQIRASHAVPVA